MPLYNDPSIDKAKSLMSVVVKNTKNKLLGGSSSIQAKVTQSLAQTAYSIGANVSQMANSKISKLTSSVSESLNNALSRITGSGTQALASLTGKFSNTAFVGKAVDAVGTVDVYGLKTPDVINTVVNRTSSAISQQVSDTIHGVGSLAQDLPNMIHIGSDGISFSKEGLSSRLKSTLGSSSILDNITGSMKNTLLGAVNHTTENLLTKFEGTINDVTHQMSSVAYDNVKGLFDSIQTVTKNPEIAKLVDVGAESQLMTGLFKEAIDLKLPDAITTLVDHAGSTTSVKNALKNIVGDALQSGSSQVVKTIAQKVGSAQILAIDPKAAKTLLSRYTLPQGTKKTELPALAIELKQTLQAVDPQWNTTVRDGQSISNLTVFHQISNDAKQVLSTDPELKVQMEIAQFYPPQSFLASTLEKYPMYPTAVYP